ncbi:response regulator [Opitutus terrae]|uniref:Two component transcriptional regulator, LuxR family n=1 Tax=Opitutus terrae (strain DSM 11246 / JCM 15787 / PB90-1) TaxID=452637 RepID=B1ZVR4_OPITP|nr:response regulator transcription factor [Opitutus terrae]ACB75000.1 two component transcriptional regulator, LuxR family [Opitutus terrae PB90-1]
MPARSQSVLVVDDHPVVVAGLRLLFESAAEFRVVGEARDAFTARRLTEELRPDLIVLDLVLGGRDGLELIEDLLALHETTKVLVYSSQDEVQYARRALRAGARGYVSKTAGLDAVGVALTTIAQGDVYVSATVQRSLVRDYAESARGVAPAPIDALSNRELQVFRLLGTGLGSADVASELRLSLKTVSTYRERLKNKLALENARELERAAEAFVRTGRLAGGT